jgi:hypothetical protein
VCRWARVLSTDKQKLLDCCFADKGSLCCAFSLSPNNKRTLQNKQPTDQTNQPTNKQKPQGALTESVKCGDTDRTDQKTQESFLSFLLAGVGEGLIWKSAMGAAAQQFQYSLTNFSTRNL